MSVFIVVAFLIQTLIWLADPVSAQVEEPDGYHYSEPCYPWEESGKCEDYNMCTLDSCRPFHEFNEDCDSNYCCRHFPVLCEAPLDPVNWCSYSLCSSDHGGCIETNVHCDDNNICTTDSCHSGVSTYTCSHDLVTCTPINQCYYAVCSNDYAACVNMPKNNCNDYNSCTRDSCDPDTGECSYELIECNPIDICHTAHCSVEYGGTCVQIPKNCDDGNQFTTDWCNVTDGECGHSNQVCEQPPMNFCVHTEMSPITQQCVTEIVNCDDGSICTNDMCIPAVGCMHAIVTCDDQNPCTNDRCSVDAGGCVHEPVNCDTDIPCFTGECDPQYGCIMIEVQCDDGDACTTDLCNQNGEGCVHIPVDCNDDNVCTNEFCDSNSTMGGCFWSQVKCDDQDPCTDDICSNDAGGCVFTPKDCADELGSTLDWCNEVDGACLHARYPCNDTLLCTNDVLDDATGVCMHIQTDCGDGNPCTVDTCSEDFGGECVHTGRSNCSVDDPCFVGYCDPTKGECAVSPMDCDDKDWCTTDYCIGGKCAHDPVICEAMPCFTSQCYAGNGNCIYTPMICEDDDPRTEDWCEQSVCKHQLYPCSPPPGDKCTIAKLDKITGECVREPRMCEDGNPCTEDSCRPQDGLCIHITNPCNDDNLCTIDVCDPLTGFCINTEKDCSDSDECTHDRCLLSTGKCMHDPPVPLGQPCNGPMEQRGDHVMFEGELFYNNSCKTCVCFPGNGEMYSVPTDCDDGNPCTADLCMTGDGCHHYLLDCDDGNPCTIDGCDGGSGKCRHGLKNCDDGKEYTNDTCSMSTGACNHFNTLCELHQPQDKCMVNISTTDGICIVIPKNCDDSNDCTTDSCLSSFGCVHVYICKWRYLAFVIFVSIVACMALVGLIVILYLMFRGTPMEEE